MKNAIEQMVEWLEKQFESDRWNATYKNAVHDCLLMARSLALERPTLKTEIADVPRFRRISDQYKHEAKIGEITVSEAFDGLCNAIEREDDLIPKPTPPPQSLVEALEELVRSHKDVFYPSIEQAKGADIVIAKAREILAKFKEAK